MMGGAAFEDDLLDPVAVAPERADDPGIERRALGEFAERTEEESSQLQLPAGDVLGGLDGGDGVVPFIPSPASLSEQATVKPVTARGGISWPARMRPDDLQVDRLRGDRRPA